MSVNQNPVNQAYNQYNNDTAQWQADCAAEQQFAAQWQSLIGEITSLLAAGKTQEAFSIVQFQLLGPTIIDGYEQSFQNIQGDIMNITSDIRNLQNIAQGVFNDSNSKTPLTTAQKQQFAEAMNDLYKIFASQAADMPGNANWLDSTDATNALQNLNNLFSAFGKSPSQGQMMTTKDASKMHSWWPTGGSSSLPNPNISTMQNGFQSLGGVINSPSQSAQTQASYMAQSENSIEGALKTINASIINFEGVEVQNEKAQ